MTGHEHSLLAFLLPNWGDPLQRGFFSVIFLLLLGTLLPLAWLKFRAKSTAWERSWRSKTQQHSSGLNVEHGSVTDLHQAIATLPEKLAEFMPGILLVVGLLGTFVGLGLALDEASKILSKPNALSAIGVADSMQSLQMMLKGLGTKFKTSVWGLTGFLLIKGLAEIFRIEEERLAWVIGKVNAELDREKQEQKALKDRSRQDLFDQIQQATASIIKGFSIQADKLINASQTESQRVHAEQKALKDRSRQDLFDQIQQATASIIEGFSVQADKLINASQAESQRVHVEQQGLLKEVAKQAIKHIHNDLEQISATSSEATEAMKQFTTSTQTIIEGMQGAAQDMGRGSQKVSEAASELVEATQNFQEQFKDVLDGVRRDLGSAIKEMSDRASDTLKDGSSQLSSATREISSALDMLSEDVKVTMTEVKNSIGRALDIQKNTSIAFTESSQTLNENITAVTQNTVKLGKPIEEGLKAISTSNRLMSSVGKTLDESMQAFNGVVQSLEKTAEHLNLLSSALVKIPNPVPPPKAEVDLVPATATNWVAP